MAMILNRKSLREALELIGAYLEDRGESLELVQAARWAQTHDPSEGFRSVLALVLTDFGVENAETRLAPGL